MKIQKISIPNNLEELSNLRNFIEQFIGDSINSRTKNRIILSLDEIVSNIIEHGYPQKIESLVNVTIKQSKEYIEFIVEDNGIEFNPLSREEIDVEKHLEKGEDGGMGIYIVQKIMEMNYQRIEDSINRLTLRKNLLED
jgi:serine/threonine-protein kinase RsbW